MKAEARITLEPTPELAGTVGGQVVLDDMHGKFVGHLLVHQVEKAAELAGPLSRSLFSDHIA